MTLDAGPQAAPAAGGPVHRYGARHRVAGIAVAVLSAVALWVVWRLAIVGTEVRAADVVAIHGAGLEGTGSTWGAHLWGIAKPILAVVSIRFVAVALVIACLFALYRRRYALTLQLALLVVGANVTSQVLKETLTRPDVGLGDLLLNSWPSGHSTVAASVSVALAIAVPRRLRPVAIGLGVLYTSVTGVATMIGGWHRASDVVGGVLVVVGWAGLVAALDGRLEPSRGAPGARTSRTLVALLAGMALVAGATAALALDHTLGAEVLADPSRADLLIAFAGASAGILAAVCAGFAVLATVLALADDDAL